MPFKNYKRTVSFNYTDSQEFSKEPINDILIVMYPVAVLALPAPWARFLRCPLTAIQTHTKKKGKIYNEITIY